MESTTIVRPRGLDVELEVPSRHVAWHQVDGYEPYTSVLFRACARQADVIVDIGAHVGYFSVLGALSNPTARVVAVEASPENCAVLRRNVERSAPTVEVVNAVFGATDGTAVLELSEASDNNSLAGHPNSPTVDRVEVPAVTGRSLGIEGGNRLLLKIDVEGQEVAALEGLRDVLEACPEARLFVELNPKCLLRSGVTPEGLVASLQAGGYRIFAVDDHEWRWSELRAPADWTTAVAESGYANLYCIPRRSACTVAVVLHSSGLGGAERSHIEGVADLTAHGFLVHTVALGPDAGAVVPMQQAGTSVALVSSLPWWSPTGEAGPGLPTGDMLVAADVMSELRQLGPDVVLTQTSVIPQGAVAAAVLGLPHVWFVREFGDRDHGLNLPAPPRQLGAVIRSLSNRVLTNSRAVRAYLFGEDESVLVSYPIPHAMRCLGPGRAGTEADRFVVGVIGAMHAGKGQEDAIRAVAALRDDGLEVPLRLIGPASPNDARRLSILSASLGVSDLVTVPGEFGDRDEMYRSIDAVAVTSRSEAFGRVPFEAAAAGLPVVYAAAGGTVEYMTSGETGLAYSPGDVSALASAIRALQERPELRGELVAGSRRAFTALAKESQESLVLRSALHEAARSQSRSTLQLFAQWIGRWPDGNPAELREQLGALRSQFLAAQGEHELLRADAQALRSELEAVRAAHEALGARAAILDAQLRGSIEEHRLLEVSSREEAQALRAQLQEAHDRVASLHAELGNTVLQRDAAEQRATAVEQSNSWRYTAWLRWLRRRVRPWDTDG